MSAFRWRLWRFGFARGYYAWIEGWFGPHKHLIGRLWWITIGPKKGKR